MEAMAPAKGAANVTAMVQYPVPRLDQTWRAHGGGMSRVFFLIDGSEGDSWRAGADF